MDNQINTLCRCHVMLTLFVFFVSAALLTVCAFADVALVENGESRAVIVLPDAPWRASDRPPMNWSSTSGL